MCRVLLHFGRYNRDWQPTSDSYYWLNLLGRNDRGEDGAGEIVWKMTWLTGLCTYSPGTCLRRMAANGLPSKTKDCLVPIRRQ